MSAGLGPVLLELLTYRLTGHSRRDPCHYQPKEERSAWSAHDPIVRYTRKLLTDSEIDQSDLDKIREEIIHEIDSAVEQAKSAPPPLLDELLTDVYAEEIVHQMKRQSIAEALRDAIAEEMERDKAVFCIGEDIAVPGGWGGAFTVTLGLKRDFLIG